MPVTTPQTEEEKKKKKKKKTFKNVTGVRFKDLLLPTALGALASYSRPAATAAQIGLSAYKTFQAGQELEREREVGEKAAAYHTQRAEELRAARDEATGAIEDPTQTGAWLYHGTSGPNIPTPTFSEIQKRQQERGRQVLAGEAEPLTEEEAAKAPFENIFEAQQQEFPMYMQPQDQQVAGLAQGVQGEPLDPNVIQQTIDDTRAQAILDYKQRIRETAQPYESRIRSSEMAALMAPSNPAWSLGLQMQAEQAIQKQRNTMETLLQMERAQAKSRAEKARIDKELEDLKTANEADLIRLRAKYGDKWLLTEDMWGNDVLVHKTETGTNNEPVRRKVDPRGGGVLPEPETFMRLAAEDPLQLLSLYNRYVQNYLNSSDVIDAEDKEGQTIRQSYLPSIRAMQRVMNALGIEYEPIPLPKPRTPAGEGDLVTDLFGDDGNEAIFGDELGLE